MTDQFNIELGISAANDRLFAGSLATHIDEVRVGIPLEYANAVIGGVDLAKQELVTLAPGTLSINRAAHGAIGSCETIYKHLAKILIALFDSASAQPSDEDLLKLFPSTFA